MRPEDIAAYIGAAAWLPQIVAWGYQALTKPVLSVVPEQYAQAWFTSWGPSLSFRMGFFVENRDLIVDGIELVLQHQGGETRTFRWYSVTESISEITDSAGNKQTVSRDQTPIAIKISTQTMLERYVRFYDPTYPDDTKSQWDAFNGQLTFLQQKRSNDLVPEMLRSRELSELVQKRQSLYCWRAGKYDLTLKLTSPQKFKSKNLRFSFELSSVEVERLRQNLALIDTEARNYINWSSAAPNPTFEPLPWYGAPVQLLR